MLARKVHLARLCAGALLFGAPAFAIAGAPPELPVLHVPRAATSPVIDGELDDAAWHQAARIENPGSALGVPHARVDHIPTTIMVTWDTNWLYVAFACTDDQIDFDPAAAHDSDLYLHDACEVFLDPVGDGRQYVEIQVSPAGQTLDMVHLMTAPPEYTAKGRLTPAFASRERWSFREWEATGLRVSSGRIKQKGVVVGWTVELAIPAAPILKRRGLTAFPPGELRANFARYDWQVSAPDAKRTLLPVYWSPVEYGCPHISAARMGRLILDP